MRCHEVEAQLMRFVDDRLPAAAARKVDAHLDVCPRCRRAYADEVELCAAFRADGLHPAGDELVEAVMDRVQAVAEARRRTPTPVVTVRPGPLAALTAAAAVALLLAWQLGGTGGSAWGGLEWTDAWAARMAALSPMARAPFGSSAALLQALAESAAGWLHAVQSAADAAAGAESILWIAAGAALLVGVALVSRARSAWAEEHRS